MNTNLFETFKYAKIKKSLKRRKEQDQAKTKYLKYRERSDKNIGEEDTNLSDQRPGLWEH